MMVVMVVRVRGAVTMVVVSFPLGGWAEVSEGAGGKHERV